MTTSLNKQIRRLLVVITMTCLTYIITTLWSLEKRGETVGKLKKNSRRWYDIRAHENDHQVLLNDQLLGLNRGNAFPEDDPCPYLGVRRPMNDSRYQNDYFGIACSPHRPTEEACEEAHEIFGTYSKLPVEQCDEVKYKDLCMFRQPNKRDDVYLLECDWSVCAPRNPYIGEISAKYGKIVYWKYSPTNQEIATIIHRTTKNGFNFVFFTCGSLRQVLLLPHKLHLSSVRKKHQRINVNIVLVDSIARPHFYRSLPRTVKALRDVVYNDGIRSTVLDYELLQSVSQHTLDNCRPLYSGVTAGVYTEFSSDWRRSVKSLGIPVLFEKFWKLGYQTLFQEEGCWYDRWGLMLTDVERYPTPTEKNEFAKRWKDLQDRWRNYSIDDFGMTHFTCEVVDKYGETNDLDIPEKVCYNGDFISTYFLKYHLDYLESIRKHDNAVPLLHYLHLVTGHTSSGVRIRNDDVGLAHYVTEVARDPHTLTIIMSDHGHARTQYGQTAEGRFELFNPFMFVVLPENVARLLGVKKVQALVENQRRLFTTLDIHRMLMAIHDPKKLESDDYKVNGLFSVLPSNRTCESLPLTPMTRCKCEGWDQRVENNSPRHAWLAEFALGQLNNMIQEQFVKGRGDKSQGGHGACVRLRGLGTRNNLERQTEKDIVTTMDIIAESPLPNTQEVFQVLVKTPLIPNEEMAYAKLVKFDRHSLYSKYAHCVDEGVDIKLCACATPHTYDSSATVKDVRRQATRSFFGAETEAKTIDGTECLLLLSRKQNFSISYEVTNLCDSTYVVTVEGETYNMLLTAKLPLELIVEPRTIHFLLSATRYVVNDSFFNIKTTYKLVER